jgi:ribosome-binding protein aMBF1 (putative translation factor)
MPRQLDTGYRSRRLAKRLEDPAFSAEYDRARAEIAQVDEIIQSLDSLRAELGISKAALARAIGKDPATVRRLFTSEINPGLQMVASLAQALGASLEVKRDRRKVAPAVARERELVGAR